MRLNDRVIREELRSEAMSVPIPDGMWANISRELAKDEVKARIIAQPRRSSRGTQVRQMLAVGAAAGIFWMMVIPSGAYVDRVQQPAPSPAASSPAEIGATEVPWDIPSEAHLKEVPHTAKPQAPKGRVGTDFRLGTPEIMIR